MPPDLKERAVRRARAQKISFGEFVRQAVEQQLKVRLKPLGKKKTGDPFWDNWVPIDDDGPTDMALNHDKYLYEALEDELRGHRRVSGQASSKRPVQQRSRSVVANSQSARANQQSRGR
ncbi:MAG TPA: hypothetical protein VN841_22550 [Bryobacteraceae bacterium]|nr:hypothetical protein [Bryobacteraceae bacterium]